MSLSPPPPPAPDPDPTTQLAWPTSSNGRANDSANHDVQLSPEERYRATPQKTISPPRDVKDRTAEDASAEIGKKRLTTLQLFNLSISMAGAQVAWTVELGCVTPFE